MEEHRCVHSFVFLSRRVRAGWASPLNTLTPKHLCRAGRAPRPTFATPARHFCRPKQSLPPVGCSAPPGATVGHHNRPGRPTGGGVGGRCSRGPARHAHGNCAPTPPDVPHVPNVPNVPGPRGRDRSCAARQAWIRTTSPLPQIAGTPVCEGIGRECSVCACLVRKRGQCV